MLCRRLAFCAALLLALPSAGFGAAESAGLFSPDREAVSPRPATRDLRVEAPGFGGGLRRGAPAAEGALPPLELRSRIAEIDFGQLESAQRSVERRRPHRLSLNLFADAEFDAVFERSAATASGYTLTGRLADEPMSTVALAVNGEWVAGTVWSPHGRYAVRPLGGGVAEVRQLDPSALGRCGTGADLAEGPPGQPPPEAGPRSGAALPKSAPLSEAFPEDDGGLIDLLVVYPSFARRSMGGHLAMRALIDSDVALTNEMYQASGATQRINLVASVELPRRPDDESDRSMPNHLDRLADGSDGRMDEVHELRDAYAADMVLMHWGHLTGLGRGLTIGGLAGVAFQMGDLSGGYAPHAFSVSNSFAFAHELGHSMGLRHHRADDAGNTPFPYSHGHVVPHFSPGLPPEREGRGMFTIMASGGSDLYDIPRFSNPNLRYPDGSGAVIGVPGDEPSDSADGPADAVRSLNGTRRVVSNFRRSAARCRYELSAPEGELPASGGEFRIGVRAGAGCAWSAWSNDDFVSVAEGAGGVGDGEVTFRVTANRGWEREAAVFVAGETHLALQGTNRVRRETPVCSRPANVRLVINAAVGKEACGEVTAADLAAVRVLDMKDGWGALSVYQKHDFPVGSFDGLTGLVSLDLSLSLEGFTTLDPDLFDGLTRLARLDLSRNRLEALGRGVFEGAPNLASLNLDENWMLETIEPGAFRGLANMDELRLYEVGLTELRAGAFEGLTNLRRLTVRYAPVAKMEPGAFDGLTNLGILHLDLSGLGKVAELPAGLFDGLDNLRDLTLWRFEEVAELPSGLFDGLDNLQILDLAVFDEVDELPSGLFDGLDNLQFLRLASFYKVEELPSGLFNGLANLRSLNFIRSRLQSLEPGVFDGLGALVHLFLQENQLRSLDPDVFEGLSRLDWLNLSDNQLTALHPSLFRGLGNLTVLDLYGNQLSTLDAGLFDGQRDQYGRSSMHRMDLSRNRLTRLEPGLLRGMERLKYLELQDNGLAALPPRLFEGLYSLVGLDLSGNPGAPFAFRPELVRVEGASDSGGAAEVALDLPQGAAFDLRVGLSASGGALSAGEAGVLIGQTRSGAVAVRPNGAGSVTVRMTGVSEVPGSPCTEPVADRFRSSSNPCLKGVRTALGAPLALRDFVLHGLSDQALAPGGALRFDLGSAFPDFPGGTTYAVEVGNPAVAEAVLAEGLLTVAASGRGDTTVAVTATAPDGRREVRSFRVTVEQAVSSYWSGWRSVLLQSSSSADGDGY